MKLYLSEAQRNTLYICLDERVRAIHKQAKEEKWHPLVIAASLTDLRDVIAKLKKPTRGGRK